MRYFIECISRLENVIMTPVVMITGKEETFEEKILAVKIPKKHDMVDLEGSGLFFCSQIIKASIANNHHLKKVDTSRIEPFEGLINSEKMNKDNLELYSSSNSNFLFIIEKRVSHELQTMRDLDLISVGLNDIIDHYFNEKMGLSKNQIKRPFKEYAESLATFSISIIDCLV